MSDVIKSKKKVFVVTYQSYLYGDEYEDIKYVMEENFEVKGVFSTKEKAEIFIKTDLQKEADDFYGDDDSIDQEDIESKKEWIERYEDHYDIWDIKVDI